VSAIPLSPEFLRGLREAEATYRHLVEARQADADTAAGWSIDRAVCGSK
jgi:hypothetical protein